MFDVFQSAKIKRNMIVEYDNIIQSTDYGFYEAIRTNENFKLPIMNQVTIDDRLMMIITRRNPDVLSFLTRNIINKSNYKKFDIDILQRSYEYFENPQISEFANNLKLLLVSRSIDKCTIAVDTENRNKLKILNTIFKEYNDLIKIIDINDIDEHIKKYESNTLVLNEDTAMRNIDKLEGKAVMINETGYLHDLCKFDGAEFRITKNKWEERVELNVGFFKPFKLKPRAIIK